MICAGTLCGFATTAANSNSGETWLLSRPWASTRSRCTSRRARPAPAQVHAGGGRFDADLARGRVARARGLVCGPCRVALLRAFALAAAGARPTDPASEVGQRSSAPSPRSRARYRSACCSCRCASLRRCHCTKCSRHMDRPRCRLRHTPPAALPAATCARHARLRTGRSPPRSRPRRRRRRARTAPCLAYAGTCAETLTRVALACQGLASCGKHAGGTHHSAKNLRTRRSSSPFRASTEARGARDLPRPPPRSSAWRSARRRLISSAKHGFSAQDLARRPACRSPQLAGASACTVAVRGSPVSSDSSPNMPPRASRAISRRGPPSRV